jgi:hypothetical protein
VPGGPAIQITAPPPISFVAPQELDFSGEYLQELDFSGEYLQELDFSGEYLPELDFSGEF